MLDMFIASLFSSLYFQQIHEVVNAVLFKKVLFTFGFTKRHKSISKIYSLVAFWPT